MRILIISQIPTKYEALRGLVELHMTGQVEWASSPASIVISDSIRPYHLILSDQVLPNEAPYVDSNTLQVFYKETPETQTPEGFFWAATSDQLPATLTTLFPKNDPLLDAFLPIRSELVIQLRPIPADLYLKLSNFKFVRIHKAGESLDDSDLKRFQDRSIEYFHINRKDFDAIAVGLGQLLQNQPSVGAVSEQITWNNVHRTATLIANTLGFSTELVSMVKTHLDQTLDIFSRNPETQVYVKDLIKADGGNFITAHTYLTALISVGMIHRLGWESEKNTKKLIICAILHDLTLPNESLARFKTFEELSMTNLVVEVDLTAHHRNQQIVLEIMSKWQPSQIEMPAILKYHFDCFFKGTGRVRPANQLASIFQLSHEMAHFLIEEADESHDRIPLGAFLDRLDFNRPEYSLIKRVL